MELRCLMRESYTHHAQPELGPTSMHQQQLIRDDTNSNNTHKLSVHLAGISLKTQELYVLVFCARYTSTSSGTTTYYLLPTIHYPHYPLLTTVGTSTSSGTTSRTTTSSRSSNPTPNPTPKPNNLTQAQTLTLTNPNPTP